MPAVVYSADSSSALNNRLKQVEIPRPGLRGQRFHRRRQLRLQQNLPVLNRGPVGFRMQSLSESAKRFGVTFVPERIFDGERHNDSVADATGEMRHPGLEPYRTLARISKRAFRRYP